MSTKKPCNILVSLKQVPDTGSQIRFSKENQTSLNEKETRWLISPYDEFAIEEALKLKTLLGGKVLLLTLGPARCKEALLQGLALGADEAYHLRTEADLQDPLAVARLLSEKIKSLEDLALIFCGKLATDSNDFAVPQMLASFLKWPFVTNINKLELDSAGLSCSLQRECGGGTEVQLEATLPLVLSTDKGLNVPRYATLPGIMQAKKKPLHDCPIENLPETQIEIKSLSPPPERKACEMIKGTEEEQIQQLLNILKDKEKLI